MLAMRVIIQSLLCFVQPEWKNLGFYDLELSRLKSILSALEFDGNLSNNRTLLLLLLN